MSGDKMKTEIVRPLNSRKENLYVITAVVVILFVAFLLFKLQHNKKNISKLSGNEISLYEDMSNIESSIYGDIKNALIEIDILKNDNSEYPSIEDLQAEMIPPFYKDEAWENKGSLIWHKHVHSGTTYYLGISGDLTKAGNFIIEVNNNNINDSVIYYTNEPLLKFNEDRDFHKMMMSAKKIIPFTGVDERKKYSGGN